MRRFSTILEFHCTNGQTRRSSLLAKVLESRPVEYMILILVLLDVVCVATEAGVDMKILCVSGYLMDADLISPSATELMARTQFSMVGTHKRQAKQLGAMSLLQKSAVKVVGAYASKEDVEVLVCESPEGPRAKQITDFVHTLSVAILTFFLFELFLKMLLHGRHFFESTFEVLDLVIVSVSLICDVIIEPMVENTQGLESKQLAAVEILEGLLIAMRFWRVVRIFHGVYEIQHMQQERASEKLEEKDAEIEKLRAILASHNLAA